jgi:hypothetical protein
MKREEEFSNKFFFNDACSEKKWQFILELSKAINYEEAGFNFE